MKCVRDKASGEVRRMDDQKAEELVKKGKHEFVPKHVWRETGRKK